MAKAILNCESNLFILKQIDPHIKKILIQVDKVSLYIPRSNPKWNTIQIEGEFFICSRDIDPFCCWQILNHAKCISRSEFMSDHWHYKCNELSILYKKYKSMFGLKFYNQEDYENVTSFITNITDITKQEEKPKFKHFNFFREMNLSHQAQQHFMRGTTAIGTHYRNPQFFTSRIENNFGKSENISFIPFKKDTDNIAKGNLTHQVQQTDMTAIGTPCVKTKNSTTEIEIDKNVAPPSSSSNKETGKSQESNANITLTKQVDKNVVIGTTTVGTQYSKIQHPTTKKENKIDKSVGTPPLPLKKDTGNKKKNKAKANVTNQANQNPTKSSTAIGIQHSKPQLSTTKVEKTLEKSVDTTSLSSKKNTGKNQKKKTNNILTNQIQQNIVKPTTSIENQKKNSTTKIENNLGKNVDVLSSSSKKKKRKNQKNKAKDNTPDPVQNLEILTSGLSLNEETVHVTSE